MPCHFSLPRQCPDGVVREPEFQLLQAGDRRFMGGFAASLRFDGSMERQQGSIRLIVFLPSFRGRKIFVQCSLPLLVVYTAKFLFVLRRRIPFLLPLLPLLPLLVCEEPIGRRAVVLDTIDEESRGRYAEAREASRLLVHGGVGNPDPALDERAGMGLEQTPYAGCIDADFLKRLVQ